LLIADEPTTALDVSVQDQILSLIRKLCHERKVGCLLVTHDMGVIASVTDRVAVMFMGRLVEIGTTKQVLTQPQHDYTCQYQDRPLSAGRVYRDYREGPEAHRCF
jgi:peptide/nickel transport system ATP-binding protein